MNEPKRLFLRLSAVASIAVGVLRHFTFLLAFMTLLSAIARGNGSYVFAGLLFIVSSICQLFIGILGIKWWRQLEKASIMARIAVAVVIFDLFICILVISGVYHVSGMQVAMLIPMLSVFAGLPIGIVYAIATHRFKKEACEREIEKEIFESQDVVKAVFIAIMISITVFIVGLYIFNHHIIGTGISIAGFYFN